MSSSFSQERLWNFPKLFPETLIFLFVGPNNPAKSHAEFLPNFPQDFPAKKPRKVRGRASVACAGTRDYDEYLVIGRELVWTRNEGTEEAHTQTLPSRHRAFCPHPKHPLRPPERVYVPLFLREKSEQSPYIGFLAEMLGVSQTASFGHEN